MSLMDKAKGLLNSEKGEQVTDSLLDKASDAAKSKLGEDKAAQVDKAREALDNKIGQQGQPEQPAQPQQRPEA